MLRSRRASEPNFFCQICKVPVILLLLTVERCWSMAIIPYAEDAEIYLPGVEKILHPQLFPSGQEFFKSHASMTIFPRFNCVFSAPDALAYGVRVVLMACGVDFSIVSGVLAINWPAVFECEGALGRSMPGRSPVNDSRGWDRTLHHGSILESAKLNGLRGDFHGGANAGKKIFACIFVAGVCSRHASADVGISVFVLCLIRCHGEVRGSLEKLGRRHTREFVVAGIASRCTASSRHITRRRNSMGFTTFKTGSGTSCLGSLRRSHCSGGSEGMHGDGWRTDDSPC